MSKAFAILTLALAPSLAWGSAANVPDPCGLKGMNCGSIDDHVKGAPQGVNRIEAAAAPAIPAQIRISAESFARKAGAPDKKQQLDDCKKHLLAAGGCSPNDIEVPAPEVKEAAGAHMPAAQRNAKGGLDKFAQGVKGLEQKAAGFMGAIFGLMTRG